MRKEDCYFLGKITRTHGLKGSVYLKLDTDQPELYKNLESIFVEINGLLVPFFIEKIQGRKGDALLVSFKNTNADNVEQLIGKNVYMPLSTLPPLTGKKFYYHEVIGFEIIDQRNVEFGVIQSINDQTIQPYFVLDYKGKQVVVPLIKDWILEVNRDDKFIKMELPDGLLEVFTEPAIKDE